MDLQVIAQLVPLGGVTVLLVYLLGTLIADRTAARNERDAWAKERDHMRAQHRADIAAVTADLRAQIEFQRDRIGQLEGDLQQRRQEDRRDRQDRDRGETQ